MQFELKDWKKRKGVTVADHGVTPAIQAFLTAYDGAVKNPSQNSLRQLAGATTILRACADKAAKACKPKIHNESKAMLLEISRFAQNEATDLAKLQKEMVGFVKWCQDAVDTTILFLEGFEKTPTAEFIRSHRRLTGEHLDTIVRLAKGGKTYIDHDDLARIEVAMRGVQKSLERVEASDFKPDQVAAVTANIKILKALGSPKYSLPPLPKLKA